MARKRISERKMEGKIMDTRVVLDRIEKAVEEINMDNKEKQTVRYTRRGLMTFEGKQYYFSANRFTMPIVYGATTVEAAFELAIALDNKMIQSKSKQKYFKVNAKDKYNQPNVYTDEINKGILIIKSGDKYMGYMPGAAGCRAVCYRKGGKPYSCSVKSLIKSLDKPGNQPFRTMEGQGQLIRERMIPEFMRIVKILDERTNNNPDPDKIKYNNGNIVSTENEESNNITNIEEEQIDKDTKMGGDFKENEMCEGYCLHCSDLTKQYKRGYEFVCTECGEAYEIIEDEPYKIIDECYKTKDDEHNNNDNTADCNANNDNIKIEPRQTYKRKRRSKSALSDNQPQDTNSNEVKTASETVVQKGYRRRRRETNISRGEIKC